MYVFTHVHIGVDIRYVCTFYSWRRGYMCGCECLCTHTDMHIRCLCVRVCVNVCEHVYEQILKLGL